MRKKKEKRGTSPRESPIIAHLRAIFTKDRKYVFSLLSDSGKLIVSSPWCSSTGRPLKRMHANTHTRTHEPTHTALTHPCSVPFMHLWPPRCSRSYSIVQWIKGKTSIAYSVSMSSIRGTDDSDHPLRGRVAGWCVCVCCGNTGIMCSDSAGWWAF